MEVTLESFVGNEKAVKSLRKYIEEKTPCILYGDSGIGKTSIVYLIAAELGFRVIETNASDSRRKDDLDQIWKSIQTYGLTKPLYLFDEVDGIENWTVMEKIIKQAQHPIILTANDLYKIRADIRKFCVLIRFYNPRVDQVLNHVKKIAEEKGIKPDFSKVDQDVRHSMSAVLYGGEKYPKVTDFDVVTQVFTKGNLENFKEHHYIWLMDNAHRFYSGRELFRSIRVIAKASQLKSKNVLKSLTRSKGTVAQPYYLKRISARRKAK